jgi:glycosyltransferase involved in cell wall biosynthesis
MKDSQKKSNKLSIGIIGLKGLPAFGGAATVGQSLIEVLHEKYNFTVYSVASHTDKNGVQDKYYQKVFSTFPIKSFNIFFYYLKSAIYVLLKAKHDLIHLHHIDGAFIVPILKLKFKVITTAHARPQIAEKWPWYAKLFFSINEVIAIKMSDEFSCVSKALTAYYKKRYKRTFYYIPNGISRTINATGESVNYNDYLLFAAGRIIPLKGLHLFLTALNNINYKKKIIVLGNLDQMPDYKEKTLNISKNLDVEFIGLIKNKARVYDYLEQARLFVFPSLSENMSMMLLEAASMKVPIICSDINENKDIFNDSEVLFFKSGDVADLENKLTYAINNTESLQTKTKNAYNKLIDQFLWENIGQQYSELYNSNT